MSQAEAPAAGADVTIDAAPEKIYALITDLPTLASLGEEIATIQWHKGDAVAPGAVFKGHNRNGSKKWTTTCTVTEAEPGRVFAFDVRHTVLPIAHWRYDIEPADGGCRVTERTWDRRPGWFAKVAGVATGVHDRRAANAEHIQATLQRLKEKAESAAKAGAQFGRQLERSATSSTGPRPRAGRPACRRSTGRARPASAAARAPSRGSGGPPTATRSAVSHGRSTRSARVRAGQIRRGDAVADVAAGPAQAGGGIEADAGRPVARHAEHATPAVRDRRRRESAGSTECSTPVRCVSMVRASTCPSRSMREA